MKRILGVLICLFSVNANAQSAPDLLIQKKYPGIAAGPAELVQVDGAAVRLKNVFSKNQSSTAKVLNYLVVPDNQYEQALSGFFGIKGKPANHVMKDGKEILILKASEVDTRVANYYGIASQPVNHVTIDGVHTIFVEKKALNDTLAKCNGIKGFPSNYLSCAGEFVQVIPVNDSRDLSGVGKGLSSNSSSHPASATGAR